jgi:hypothetical protein
VIRTLAYHHGRKPRRDTLKKELTHFRRNRSRMQYAQLRAQNLPIGSGIIEAADPVVEPPYKPIEPIG